MPDKLRSLVPRPATILALVALAVALSGTAYAATMIGTSQIRDGAVTTRKIANGAVTGTKINNGAVTSAKVKDGTLLAKDFKPGELSSGQVQGAQGPAGPQGPTGPQGPQGLTGLQGPPGPGRSATVVLSPGTQQDLFTIGHAVFRGVCSPGPLQAGINVSAVGGAIRVFFGLGDHSAGSPMTAGEGSTYFVPPDSARTGSFSVLDEAGPSFTGQYAAYARSADGHCIITAQAAPPG